MFDLLGWHAEYEPYTLNGYIPDFVLFGKEEILVEVKPYSTLTEFEDYIPNGNDKSAVQKILNAIAGTEKDGKEILLLGCSIFPYSNTFRTSYLGWVGDYWGERGTPIYQFAPAIINYYEKKWGFFHEYNSWEDRITGLYDGNALLDMPDHNKALELWNVAGNLVQWLPPAQ